MSNSTHPDVEYSLVSHAQWNNLAERTENGENFVDIEDSILTNSLWKCPSCQRIYIFEDGNDVPLQVYNLEKNNNSNW